MKKQFYSILSFYMIYFHHFRPYRFCLHTIQRYKPLMSALYFFLFSFFFPTLLEWGGAVSAQYCTPVTTNYCCGFGITKVTFNTINNTSTNASVGYQDFSSQQTNVFVGQNYSLYVKCDVPSEHNVKAWIDWNNDKIFDDVNEVVLLATQVYTCTTSVNIPSNALFNTPLRLRIAADYYLESVPTPCDSLVRGQAEDYSIIVFQNTSSPVASFTADKTTSCDGNIQFTDNSTNLPTQWFWDFGDSTTSTLQHPLHSYISSGNFSVTLIASNSNGDDTLIKNNYISVNLAGQLTAASCTPVTTANCCNYGIYSVGFNTINNTSAGGSDSYKDYSCTKNTSVTEGMLYNLQVTTGPDNPEDLRVWLDLNNDGILNDTTEKIFTSLNSKTHSGTINIPAASAFGVPLRMRITSESVGNPVTSCTNPLFGQTEDYGVIILEFTGGPTADFTVNTTSTCNGTVNFSDLSYGLPNSWNWNFGDGTSSIQQNPSHTYTSPGIFTITLIVTNQNGADTIIKTNYISYNEGPQTTNCTSTTINYCCGMGIYSVQFNTINNNTSDGIDGYKDYSCQTQTTLAANQSYNITITTGIDYDENIRVWIDFNNNGGLNNNNELVFSSDNVYTYHSGNIFIPSSAVTNTPLRMRISADYGGTTPPLPCQNLQYGQAEDYAVIIVNISSAPVANFTVDSPNTCSGTVIFTDQSSNTPTSWLWDFGDGITSNLKNPQHTYINNGTYTVSLTATNPMGNNTKTKTNYITKSNSFCPVGKEEFAIRDLELRIYPNPNGGKFKIHNSKFIIYKMEIYNMLGERILNTCLPDRQAQYSIPNTQIDISNQPDGIYFLQISDGEKNYFQKLVLEK